MQDFRGSEAPLFSLPPRKSSITVSSSQEGIFARLPRLFLEYDTYSQKTAGTYGARFERHFHVAPLFRSNHTSITVLHILQYI
jgi:hypothetical protein